VKPAIPSSSKRERVWAALLLAATFLAYRPAWNGQPVWDDDVYMTPPELRSVSGLGQIWTRPSRVVQFYPLTHTVFWAESHLWGGRTFGYHLLNIFLHAACALLLVKVLKRLQVPGAWLAGGMFALHPVAVESVAWITELKNTLSGVFFLGAGLAYLRFDATRGKRPYAMALLLFSLGLFAKSAIVILPAALLVVFWWMRGRIAWKRDVVPLLPLFVVGITAGMGTAWVERKFVGAAAYFSLGFVDRFLIAGKAVWFYFHKLLWPADLLFIYPRWRIDVKAPWQYLPLAALLLTSVLFWRLRNRSRAPLAVLLYFVGALFPVLGFFDVYFFRYAFVADHFQYLACMGLIATVAALVVRATGMLNSGVRRWARPLLYGTLLSVLFALTWRQSGVFGDVETLYRTILAKNQRCPLAHNNLGLLLMDRGETEEAMAHFQKTLEEDQRFGDAHYNIGLLLAKQGRTDEAMPHYLAALDLDANHAKTHNNIGSLLERGGRNAEAMIHYQRALDLDPNLAEAHNNVGALLARMGRSDEATAHFLKVPAGSPYYGDAQYNLGILLARLHRGDEAMAHFQKALESNPKDARPHSELGILLAQSGQIGAAMAHLLKALEINPDYGDAHGNLGFLLANMGRRDEAIAHFRKALALAQSRGDEARANALVQILGRLAGDGGTPWQSPR